MLNVEHSRYSYGQGFIPIDLHAAQVLGIGAIHEYCKEGVIVFNKFHIVRYLIDAFDKVRRMEAKAQTELDPEALRRHPRIFQP